MTEKDCGLCREHSGVCRKIEALRELVEVRFEALDKSIAATRVDLDRRLESMNEFRAQLDLQAATFVPRSEIKLTQDRIEEKINTLQVNASKRIGASKWSDYIITVLVAFLVSIVFWLIKK